MAFIKRYETHERFNTPCDLCKKPILEPFIVSTGRHHKVSEAFHYECYHKLLASRHPPRPKPPPLIDQSEIERWRALFQREEKKIAQVGL